MRKSGEKYGQCGTFVNDYLAQLEIGRIFQSSLWSKTRNVNYSIAEFDNHWVDGAIAVYDFGDDIGHVSIVKIIDGKLWEVDTNIKGDEKIRMREYGKYNDALVGYYNPFLHLDKKASNIFFTSYNPAPAQTDSSPCIGASGVDQCIETGKGARIIALSQDLVGRHGDKAFKYGDRVKLVSPDQPLDSRCNGEFIVMDTMNARYKNRGDIFFMNRSNNVSCHANIFKL